MNALRRSIKFFFSTSSSNNFSFAFLALKVDSFYLKDFDLLGKLKEKSITFFAAHLAESSLRGELAWGPLFQVLHGSCS